MVTLNEVWAAADRIRARTKPGGGTKERVSVRNVRRELGGGSHEDIGPPLALWKERRDYQPVIEEAGLPLALQALLTRFGAQVLEQARIEEARKRLAEAASEERRREANDAVRDEALAYADLMEARVAALQAEVDRLRAGAPAPAVQAPAVTVPEPAPPGDGKQEAVKGFIGILMGRSLAREADAFWDEVRAEVEAAMRRRGPLAVHALHGALPAALKDRGARIGMPLTPAWLRCHLLRLAEAGQGVAEVEGRFALAEMLPPAPPPPAPEPHRPPDDPFPPRLTARKFWMLFVAEVHDTLTKCGALTVDGIMEKLPEGWMEATARYGKAAGKRPIGAGRLRQKLRQRIAEGRPFAELDDGRFATMGPWPGKGMLGPDEAA